MDIREIGSILRFLGCVPSEAEVSEVIAETEFEDSNGTVHLSKFLPHVHQLLIEHKWESFEKSRELFWREFSYRMEPAAPEKLLEAFQVLDPEGKGYVTKEYMSKIMMEEGEPFSQEELEEMMSTAVDQSSGLIPYEYYLNQLMVKYLNTFLLIALNQSPKKPQHEPKESIYDIADRVAKDLPEIKLAKAKAEAKAKRESRISRTA